METIKPTYTLVVTRVPALAEYLRLAGTVSPDTPVKSSVSANDVLGHHVIGLLPMHLAAAAETYTEIPLRSTPADRKAMADGDMTVERIGEIAGPAKTYRVRSGLALVPERTAIPVELGKRGRGRDEWIDGGDRSFGGQFYVSPDGLLHARTKVHFDTRDLGRYRDGGSWTLIGRMLVDPVAWADGRIVEGRKTWRQILAEREAEGFDFVAHFGSQEKSEAKKAEWLAEDGERPDPIELRVAVVAEVYWTAHSVQQRPVRLYAVRDGEVVSYVGRWRGLQSVGVPLAHAAMLLDWVADGGDNRERELDACMIKQLRKRS